MGVCVCLWEGVWEGVYVRGWMYEGETESAHALSAHAYTPTCIRACDTL